MGFEFARPESARTVLTDFGGPAARRTSFDSCYATYDESGGSATDELIRCIRDETLAAADAVARALVDGGHSAEPTDQVAETIRELLLDYGASARAGCAAFAEVNPAVSGQASADLATDCELMMLGWAPGAFLPGSGL